MKKPLLSFLLSMLLGGYLCAQTVPSSDSYALNFDRLAPRTRSDRVLTSISLSGANLTLDNPEKMYNDMTHKRFVVHAGQTVVPVFGYTGSWMQGYVYIDKNQNGEFDVQVPGGRGQLTVDNELVSFAGMTLAEGNYNSAGKVLSNLSGVQPPEFSIPNLEPGVYMMRWKVDWDDADPAGRMDEKNDIISNGGAIVDVLLRVLAEGEEDEEAYQLVFSDEFDQPDGSLPDPEKWSSSARQGATWNRWISNSPDVAYIKDGSLLCRAIPNQNTSVDNVPMITGSMETRGKFSFAYGKVEVKLRTNLHVGNFPAAWMMPQPPADMWPLAGEIDIFESIDAQTTAFHTVHSHWTYDLGHRSDPPSSFSERVAVDSWHVYGVEWTEDLIQWTVDGNVVGTYAKSSDSEVLSQGQWPFDHPFYLILNQSVGNGSWAQNADTEYYYDTYFDYVRVYQRVPVHVEEVPSSKKVPSIAVITDLNGRKLGRVLKPGVYIRDGRKFVISKVRSPF